MNIRFLSIFSIVFAAFFTIGIATAQTLPPAIKVLAAGSLTGAMKVVAEEYQRKTGQVVETRFGPSGVLREEIEQGVQVDIFASANMAHPQLLADTGRATLPVIMLRNRLCARALPELGLRSDNVLERMLDPEVGIGTSTPIRDPGGDYAWMVFARAGEVKPGAKEILEAKAKQISARKNPLDVPAGQNVVDYLFAQNRIHMTLGYCSGRTTAPDSKYVSVPLPPELAVNANYGLSVIFDGNRSREDVYRFALYLMSTEAQAIMAQYGFIPTTAMP